MFRLIIRELPSVLNKDTGQQLVNPKTQKPQYQHPIDVLPRKPRRYKEAGQFNFFGKRYVIGATDPDFLIATKDTLLFTFFSVSLQMMIGLIIALTLHSKFKGRGMMRAVMLLPWATIAVVSARIWEWMLTPSRIGFFNVVFQKLGFGDGQIAFLSRRIWQLPSLIAADVWKETPFVALILLAGLQVIPTELYEASRVDGANRLRQFLSITLPLLRPAIGVALVFRTMAGLRTFDLFQVLLAQKRYSLATYNYYMLIGNRAMGYGSSIGVMMFILIFAFAFFYIRALGVNKEIT